ncbi:putative clustered mitochondria protein [Dioscorea sansibarensis]
MAGKSKAKNKGRGSNSNAADSLDSNSKTVASSLTAKSSDGDALESLTNGREDHQSSSVDGVMDSKAETANPSTVTSKPAEGEVQLYPISVKTQAGGKLELQLSPADSVMDIRQFLLDAPETCFFTCYDLILHTKDGSSHHLGDYNEISEVVDITVGGCSLEMVAALYDERSIRSHIHRARELLSLSTLHTSTSTLLALQSENTKQKSADAAKVEIPELDGLGFMEDVTGSLGNLTVPSTKKIDCLESLIFSSFNPPPSYRRLVGDLIYLDVVTLEGNKFCITGTTNAFYVNSSTGNILDSRQVKSSHEASTLIGLLQKLSPKFKKGFHEILSYKASAHPFENVQSLLPTNSWLGAHPIPDHKRDASRAEDAVTLSFGADLIGMQRDWNEELQACREFPHQTLHERILRNRALYKVSCDFVDAATNGAIGVINRCIPPLNPTDPEYLHMYAHNNIFFSFAVDAELRHVSNDHKSSVKSKVDRASEHSESSKAEVQGAASDVCAEALIADCEQATYASSNNDLKGTKAFQEADVPGLYNLAMAIIDHRGYRVVAQSIIPGILQGKSDSLLYGSMDNGKTICWNESFHSKVLEAANHLHLKEHTVLDGSGNAFKLAAPVECKGIVGSDDRHYLLDLMRVTPRDANYPGSESRFCILRPELITSFYQAEAAERSSSKSETGDAVTKETDSQNGGAESAPNEEDKKPDAEEASTAADSSPSEAMLLNPNVLTEFKLGGSEEEITADEEMVKKAGSFLMNVVLPKFVQDLCALEVSPMDGQTLTDALHSHGINIRYLGKVAEMTKHLPHLRDICTNEIIVRSAKHILKDLLMESLDHDLGQTISHFLNCFIGNVLPRGGNASATKAQLANEHKAQKSSQSQNKTAKGHIKWGDGASTNGQSAYMLLTSEKLWSYIQGFARFKYQFESSDEARLGVKNITVVRNLCQKVGIKIAARKYDLEAAAPFQISDVLDLLPVVKHSVPVCSEARDLMDTGKARLAEGLLNEAYVLFSEAFALLQQVTGPMHREVASCCRYLAMVLYHAGDIAGAIMQQHKELIINERCLGLDHPDTAHSYGNMALFYHGLNQTELALRHMSRTLLLLSLSSGPDHPDVAATFINVAMMYQDIGKMDTALRYLQEALKKNERLLGSEHIQTAVCYHALAIAFNCMRAYKLSLQNEKKTYDILVKQLGEEDSRTRDSENWIKTFQLREQQANVQKQKGQAVNVASAQGAVDFLRAHPEFVQAFQAASLGSGKANRSSVNRSINSSMISEALPRGRGVDERAARAAAQIRKKAAARGHQMRPNAVPTQALPQVAHLLNVINSGASTTQAQPNEHEKLPSTGSGSTSNGTVTTNEPVNIAPPVGLGTGLASLDSKKQKLKTKG